MARFISNMLAGLFLISVLPGKAHSEIGFIQLGHISKIDAKNHTVTLLVQKDEKNDEASVPPGGGGFSRGRFGRFGGPPGPDIAKKMQRTYETKVILKPETILKDRKGSLRLDELEAGDFVEIDGVMHGT